MQMQMQMQDNNYQLFTRIFRFCLNSDNACSSKFFRLEIFLKIIDFFCFTIREFIGLSRTECIVFLASLHFMVSSFFTIEKYMFLHLHLLFGRFDLGQKEFLIF